MRAAVRIALPLAGLAALAVVGALRAPSPIQLVPATQGSGSLTPTVVVRVLTDGRPELVTIPLRPSQPPVAAVLVPAPVVRHTVATAPVVRHRAARPAAPRPVGPPSHPAAAVADAYPYADDTSDGPDPWGFTKRQCVSYVAWRLAQQGTAIDNATQGWGSAYNWAATAQRLGYSISSRPTVGSVAQWDAHETSPYWGAGSSTANGTFAAGAQGHVAWVTKVFSDGSVLVAQYNGTVDRGYSTMRVKAPRYLSI